ncbi:hypothetical protein BIV57_19960 [Mangrovactinospora gilvigrisea]|uniref:Integral membrane protein n=1 Tax=Mangrovactinospora gilvigrisea TaxID=1428644 RepID=A0A1J7C2G2_9ACTN|nr:hypothetical protein [Mangrovactinospora gilvigrisea]OIV35752.1 hypothetical protein BIV57_19960 [Mangrovactinospora gilvigrisea]
MRARFTRLARLLGLDRNTLRRRADRVRTLLGALLGLLVAGAAVGAWVLGVRVYHAQQDAVQRMVARLHRVPATALETAPAPADGSATGAHPTVMVRWTDPVSRARLTGEAQVPDGTVRGERVPIWLTSADVPAPIPQRTADLAAGSAGVGAVAWLGATGVLVAGHLGARRLVTSRQLRAWEREWDEIGPRWSKRFH